MRDWLGTTQVNATVAEELLVDDFYTAGIKFDGSNKVYTYKVDNSIKLEEEDLVVVATNTGLTIVTVVRIDEEIQIEFDSSFVYKYIIDKVDFTLYTKLGERSKAIRKTMTEVGRRQLKKTLLAEFSDSLTEDGKKLLEINCGIILEDTSNESS